MHMYCGRACVIITSICSLPNPCPSCVSLFCNNFLESVSVCIWPVWMWCYIIIYFTSSFMLYWLQSILLFILLLLLCCTDCKAFWIFFKERSLQNSHYYYVERSQKGLSFDWGRCGRLRSSLTNMEFILPIPINNVTMEIAVCILFTCQWLDSCSGYYKSETEQGPERSCRINSLATTKTWVTYGNSHLACM